MWQRNERWGYIEEEKQFEIQMSRYKDCPKESCTGKRKLREKREGHWTPKEWKKMMGKGHIA